MEPDDAENGDGERPAGRVYDAGASDRERNSSTAATYEWGMGVPSQSKARPGW